MAENNTTYERRGGVDASHGIDFEWHTTILAYLRCEKLQRQWVQDNTSGVKSYIVANNVDGIGAFDDMVIRATYPHQNEDKTKLIFVQGKHFINPKKVLLDKLLNRATVQKYFDSFIEILRILNDHRAVKCQTYKEIEIRKKTKRQSTQEIDTNTEKEQKLRNLFQCKPQDCEFILYSNTILDAGFENTQTQQDNDIPMNILNTARSIDFNISLNAKQLEYLPNEQFDDARENFEELKKEFATKFRIFVNQADNINVDLLKSIIPTADIRGIYPLLEEEVKCKFQNIPSTAITENSELLENIENYCKLKTAAKNEMENFLRISEHGNLFSNESIENLQKQFKNEALPNKCTSGIELEKLKQFVTNGVQGSKLLVFIKNENDFRIWTKARKSRLYKNLDQIFVCLENTFMLSGYIKDTNEVFIEIHQNMENDPSFYFAQFSDETLKLILNYGITFQGFKVSVNDICGDEWRHFLDEETIFRIFGREEIKIGSKFFNSFDCYIERSLQFESFEEFFFYRNDKKTNISYKSNHRTENANKSFTEDEIIAIENEKVILLSGSAGTGKSTTLRSLALKYKRKNPTFFVYFIELNKYLNVLKKYKQECDVTGAIDFLAKHILCLQQLEYQLFVYACREKKIAVFFDAFDEISPDGEENFSSFLKTLLKTLESRIYVSSRPNFIGTLEKILKQDSLIFLPFTLEEQKNIFMKFYEKLNNKIAAAHEKEEIENIIQRFITTMEEEKGTLKEFLAIPLQITILAEIYLERINEMTTDEKTSFSFKIDICSLYNAFIEKLVERYLFEKKRLILQDEEKIIAIRDKLRGAEELVCKLICPDINQTPLAEYNDAIIKMCRQVGLITNIDPPVFLHRTYGEFMTASYFVQYIMNENRSTSSYVSFLCKNVLFQDEYREIRKFFNAILCNLNSGENDSSSVKPNGMIFVFCEYETSSLHIAAQEKNAEIVKLLVQNDPSKINWRNRYEETALLTACEYGDFKSVNVLVSNSNCIINIENFSGRNALHHVAYGGNAEIINLILEKDPTLLSKTDNFETTALNLACRFNTTEVVMSLLKLNGGLVNIADKLGNSPLHHATKNGNIQIVKAILSYNSNLIDKKCHDGFLPLHIACKKDHIEVAEYFVKEKKSLVNVKCGVKEETPLHFAARNGNVKLMMLLLNHDKTLSIINECNSDEESPLLCALQKKQIAAAKFLLFLYCVVNKGENPLTLAAQIGDVDILRKIHSFDCTLLNKVGEKHCRGRTPLLCALEASNIEAANYLLKIPECLLISDLDGKSPLHYAAINGNEEILKQILNKDRTLLLKQDKNRNSALSIAIDAGETEKMLILLSYDEYSVESEFLPEELESVIKTKNIELMTMMLKHRPSLANRRNLQELLPLEIAFKSNNIEAVNYLLPLTHSALIQNIKRNTLILHTAAKERNLSMTQLILDTFPTLLNQRDSFGRTVLYFACKNDDTKVAKLLLKQENCKVFICDKKRQNPLHLASKMCNIDIIKMILDRDSTLLNRQNNKGQTPLHVLLDQHTQFGGSVSEVAKHLINLNCLLNVEDVDGNTPIYLAWKRMEDDIVKLFLERDGTLLNLKDKCGCTPLHHACEWGRYERVKFLLNFRNCDTDLTDKRGNTALHHAARNECEFYTVKILSLLLQRDRTLLNVKNKMGLTALHLAASARNAYAIEYLLDLMECKVFIKDKYGDTPLHSFIEGKPFLFIMPIYETASIERKISLFSKLDSSLLNIKNKFGQTPLHMAVKKNKSFIVDYLINLKADVHIMDNENHTPLDLAIEMKKNKYGVTSLNQNIIDILQKAMSENISTIN